MRRTCIGVHVHAEPARLLATLRSLCEHTPPEVGLLLLPDGPDAETRAALAELEGLPQSATAEAQGAPACFNRLAALSDADVIVLLESGAQVAPLWLEQLLAALEDDPRNGLAGPTTNCAWNEQGVYPHAGGTPELIARTAREARARFRGEARVLEPLHSLADFCYAVRREVLEKVGGADESYGLGPCWEMDYNVRAARAGFRGVWACAAYVHRAPFTARRRREEARRFEAVKRLYQDKFCGARLRGEKADYRAHCRGDACPNFAPAQLIKIQCPLPTPLAGRGDDSQTAASKPVTTMKALAPLFDQPASGERLRRTEEPNAAAPQSGGQPAHAPPHAQKPEPLVSFGPSSPLVSCIMPTGDRRGFVAQAVRYFLRQDYPNLELLILDDGGEALGDAVPEDERIRYVRLDQRLSLGAKRNAACELARGEIVAHWDDDDWYPPWRLSAQVRALVEGPADVTGTSRLYFFDAVADRAWEYRYTATGSPWVAGSTLAYRKRFWERNRFPDVQVGEDSLFLWSGAAKTVCDLDDARLAVASVHSGNTSPKETGGVFWQPRPVEEVHAVLGDDLHLCRAVHPPGPAREWPPVSCIMPTYNRRGFVPLALRSFLAQDYPRKELIVVDDGDAPVGDLVEGLPGVRYLRLGGRATIGAKRNLACGLAEGQIIAHWDDDDWYAPDRLRYQVRPLLAGEADITGLYNSFVLELPGGAFWTTQPQLHRRMFVGDVHGGTLVYRRELVDEGINYPEINLAEDAWLLHTAVGRGKRLLRLPNPGLFVYVRHGRNAWGEFAPGSFLGPSGWQRIEPPYTFTIKHLDLYRSAAASL